MPEHIPNAELRAKSLPARDADFSDGIYPFAMAYHGYEVWGDENALRNVAATVSDQHARTGSLPQSLTKLRTSLFAMGRSMRFTDFDEDVLGVPGTEAQWIALMRAHVVAISDLVAHGPAVHLPVIQAAATAAARLAGLEHPVERDLQQAIATALADLLAQPVASSASHHEHAYPQLPFWDAANAPGPFDVIVGDLEHPSLAVEVKWSAVNTLSHSLWDVLKLLGVLALGAEQVYMIAGYPSRVWDRAEFARLYSTGTVRYTDLPLAKEWPSLLKHSQGTPERIPNAVEITELARITVTHANEPWQLRVVAIDPTIGGWLRLADGRLDGAQPVGEDPNDGD